MHPPRDRRPITLRAPITLGVVLIVLVVILGAVWVTGTLVGIVRGQASPELYWVMLLAGSALLIAVLAGVIAYLTLSVKAFNLNRRQSNFIDAVTHELKSPIASLKLYLQTMTRHSVSQEQSKAFHQIMLEDVERLDTLINHLLDAANVERGIVVEEARDIPLRELLEQVGDATCLRYKLPPESVVVECENIVLHAPKVQLEILMRNLIDNAVKYGGVPPRVRILTELMDPIDKPTKKLGRRKSAKPENSADPATSQEVTISVCDNGVGIPANLRRKVFGRFVRLGNELERSNPGTGLGLYLVRNVTHALGGRINIHDAAGIDFGPPTDGPPREPLTETDSAEGPGKVETPEERIGEERAGKERVAVESAPDIHSPPDLGTRFDITLPGVRRQGPIPSTR